MRISLPGIGGSLGECVACGKSFALEVITGKNVETIRMKGFSQPLPVHSKCCDEIVALAETHSGEADSWMHLPDGPLRQEFAQAAAELRKDRQFPKTELTRMSIERWGDEQRADEQEGSEDCGEGAER